MDVRVEAPKSLLCLRWAALSIGGGANEALDRRFLRTEKSNAVDGMAPWAVLGDGMYAAAALPVPDVDRSSGDIVT